MMEWISVKDRLPDENVAVEARQKDGTELWAHRYVLSWFFDYKKKRGRKAWQLDVTDTIVEWRLITPPKEDIS